jgi:MFS family permease
VQTGFGPFISVYLTGQGWTQAAIGEALSVGTVAAMVCQLPGGIVVDRLRSKRMAAELAVVGLMLCALSLLLPMTLVVIGGQVLHGLASCILGPAIAAMSLAISGLGAPNVSTGERLGRNARYSAVGSGAAAMLMGFVGTSVSESSVFVLAAMLCIPALFAVRRIGSVAPSNPSVPTVIHRGFPDLRPLLDRRLILFALCCAGFQFSNAAMLNLAAGRVTHQIGSLASLVIALCIVVPQGVMAILAPLVGRLAESRGRRIVLVVGFMALPLRAGLLAFSGNPVVLVCAQALDGIGASVMGVCLPLVVADIAGRSGHFNLCLGAVGLAVGLGATLSNLVSGHVADLLSVSSAFLVLGGAGILTVLLTAMVMPETCKASLQDGCGAAT